MSILQRLLGTMAAVTEFNTPPSLLSPWSVGGATWTTRRYDKFADESYVKNAVAHRCIKMICGGASRIPWMLMDAGGKEIEEHPLLDLLTRPQPLVNGRLLWESVLAYLLISGDTFLEGVGTSSSYTEPPKELWPHRPDWMKVNPGRFSLPKSYEFDANGVSKTWKVDQVTGESNILHVKEFNPLDNWRGMPRVDPAAYGIDRHNGASAHNKALLDNGARPSGALIFKPVVVNGVSKSAPEPVIREAEARLAERHINASKAGRPFVFGGDVDWKEMSISPRDMDFSAGKDDAARDICHAFGVPHILLVPGSATYNNVVQARVELYEDNIIPLAEMLDSALNTWLTPRFGPGLMLQRNLDKVSALIPRRETKQKGVVEIWTAGLIDRNEARTALDYDVLTDEKGKEFAPAAAAVQKKADENKAKPGEDDKDPK